MNINLEQIDYLREQNIQFCIVCRGGMVTTATFNSFDKWTKIANQMRIEYTVNTIRDSIEEKNAISTHILNTPGPTHMLFIDADMEFEPFHILALLSAKKHIIGASLGEHHSYLVHVEEPNLKSVTEVSTSFIMIDREALAYLKGVPWHGVCSKWRDLGGHVWAHEQVNPTRT